MLAFIVLDAVLTVDACKHKLCSNLKLKLCSNWNKYEFSMEAYRPKEIKYKNS